MFTLKIQLSHNVEYKYARLVVGGLLMNTTKATTKSTNADGRTLEEIASMFDITRERVRQIEAKALRSLRQKLTVKGIYKDILQNS